MVAHEPQSFRVQVSLRLSCADATLRITYSSPRYDNEPPCRSIRLVSRLLDDAVAGAVAGARAGIQVVDKALRVCVAISGNFSQVEAGYLIDCCRNIA